MQKHNQTEADLMAIVQKPFNQSIFGEKFGMKILNNSFYDRTILWTTLCYEDYIDHSHYRI